MKKIKFWLVIVIVAICLFMSLDNYSYRGAIEDFGLEQVRRGIGKVREMERVDSSTEEAEEDRNSECFQSSDTMAIVRLIEDGQKGDLKSIAGLFVYPIERPYPLPAIKDSAEFVRRGNVIFDDSLKAVLAHATIKDWETIGWRGILLEGYFQAGGWGSGSITHLIYVSKEEERLLETKEEEDLKTLHPSLRDGLDRPRFAFRTIGKDWIARLDVMKNGKHRLALYKRDADLSGEPDFVAEEWDSEVEGSADNETIYFYNDTLSVSLSISSDSKYCTLEITERYEQMSWRTLLQEQSVSHK